MALAQFQQPSANFVLGSNKKHSLEEEMKEKVCVRKREKVRKYISGP